MAFEEYHDKNLPQYLENIRNARDNVFVLASSNSLKCSRLKRAMKDTFDARLILVAIKQKYELIVGSYEAMNVRNEEELPVVDDMALAADFGFEVPEDEDMDGPAGLGVQAADGQVGQEEKILQWVVFISTGKNEKTVRRLAKDLRITESISSAEKALASLQKNDEVLTQANVKVDESVAARMRGIEFEHRWVLYASLDRGRFVRRALPQYLRDLAGPVQIG